jgi:serine/threonine protein kinase
MKIPKDLRWQPTGETLGSGGQAQVHLVTDKDNQNQKRFALKALKNKSPGQAYERFYREIDAVKKLSHKNIIRIFDHSNLQSDFHYYVMEYIDGAKSLSQLLNSSSNPFYNNPLKSLDLFYEICDVILECENTKPSIVHRDLSPANILVLPDMTIKIIDFGVCQIESGTPITLIDEGVGTINYMAPECESGSNERIAVGADLYSAGKILWSAITGKKAFAREKAVYTAQSLSEILPDNPSSWHLFHIFEKTIRNDWRERWGSAKYAKSTALFVKELIKNGYAPLELIHKRCPICGVGELDAFQASHMVFGNPNPAGILSRQCSYCGICLAINYNVKNQNLKKRGNIE